MPATMTAPKAAKDDAPTGHRVKLTICLDSTPYAVKPIGRASLPFGAVRAFTLIRTDRRLGTVSHTVAETIEGLSCSCGDQTYRQTPQGGACKHLAACQACGLF